MKKIQIYAVFVIVALVVAGLFGVIYDQIRYAVSSEYFTKYKFLQLGFGYAHYPDHVRAGLIGFLGSWKMGIPIGLLVGAAGFIHKSERRMMRALGWSLLVTFGFILVFGVCGLVYGYYQVMHNDASEYSDASVYSDWHIPPNLVNPRRFLLAGYMHYSLYIGGAISILVGWGFNLYLRAKAKAERRNSR